MRGLVGAELTWCFCQKPQYRPGDSVYYINEGTGAQEGPYVVASLPEAGKCKLIHPDGGEELISTDALVNAG